MVLSVRSVHEGDDVSSGFPNRSFSDGSHTYTYVLECVPQLDQENRPGRSILRSCHGPTEITVFRTDLRRTGLVVFGTPMSLQTTPNIYSLNTICSLSPGTVMPWCTCISAVNSLQVHCTWSVE